MTFSVHIDISSEKLWPCGGGGEFILSIQSIHIEWRWIIHKKATHANKTRAKLIKLFESESFT